MNCPNCDFLLTRDHIYRVNGTPKCGRCTAELSITFDEGGYRAQPFEPVVVFRDAAGNVRFPGRTDSSIPEGFQRVELRTSAEVHRFEREMNVRENAKHDIHAECEERYYNELERKNRRELREAMRQMTPQGRAFAEEAMRQGDKRPSGRFDAGFHLPAFHYDSSNRAEHRDERTGWKARKG